MNKNIGAKIKRLRTQKQMTLKDMSEKTNLSIGFLSQLERGLTSVATDSLEKIADVLEVDLTYFFMKPKEHKKTVIRSYEKEVFEITDGKYINYHLSSNLTDKMMFPKMIEILPGTVESDGFNYSGEEFIYVLEGILTLKMAESEVDLYPGDSIHYSYKNKVMLKNGEDSKIVNQNHSLLNKTNKVTKIIIVSVPNPYFEEEKNK